MGFISYIKQEALNFVKRKIPRRHTFPKVQESLYRDGFCVIEGFLDQRTCASYRGELDRLLDQYSSQLWRDELSSDERLFGADRVSNLFSSYFSNAMIQKALTEFEGKFRVSGYTMAARMKFVSGNRGSGNGWHRDAIHHTQTKSIIYLSDVSPSNGPFQYVVGSHTPQAYLSGLLKGLYGLDQFRYSEDEVRQYLKMFPIQKLKEFTAPAGTLLLVDTRGLHRGKPIEEGTRYAATNYYYFNSEPPEHIRKLAVNLDIHEKR